MRLRNKVVFLTDAASPSGMAIWRRLAAEGASLVLNAECGDGGDSGVLEAELDRAGLGSARAAVFRCDLTRSAEVERLLDEAAARLGPVDVLVHNQDRIRTMSVEHGEEEAFRDVMDANAKTAFVCAKAAGKRMTARGAGRIVFVNSIHAEKPTGSSFAYSASKGAVKMLAREAAVVLGRCGVSVNTIEFGPVEGDDAKFPSAISALYDAYRYKVPNATLGTHADLAELVLWLASDDARYVNGADIRMDGGFLLHYLDFKMKLPPESEGTP